MATDLFLVRIADTDELEEEGPPVDCVPSVDKFAVFLDESLLEITAPELVSF